MRRALGQSHRGSVSREVDEELAFHVEMRTQYLTARGHSPEDARALALKQFGNVAQVRDDCVTYDKERLRVMGRARVLDEIRQDTMYALRTMRRNWGFSLTVAGVIALGIGANASIFSVAHSVLLRPLPVPNARALAVVGDPGAVGGVYNSTNVVGAMMNWEGFWRLRDRQALFTDLAATGRANRFDVLIDSGQREPDRPRGRFVSANFFHVLGLVPFRGRYFDMGRDFFGQTRDPLGDGTPAVVVSHSYWMQRLNGDANAVGRDLLVEGVRLTVIGIAPPGFTGEVVGTNTEIWYPMAMEPVLNPTTSRIRDNNAYWLHAIGRLKTGTTREQAKTAVQQQLRDAYGEMGMGKPDDRQRLDVQVVDGSRGLSRLRDTWGAALVILLAGVGILLLVICANVANMLLARAMARNREMSVRLAIGAGRGRIVRQLLVESALMGVLGALAGLALARFGSRLMVALAVQGFPGAYVATAINVPVVAFTAGLSLFAVFLFGLFPALRTSRVDLASALRAGTKARGSLGSLGGGWSGGRLLIVAQVALSLVLLMAASLLQRSLLNLKQSDTGMDQHALVVLDVAAQERGVLGGKLPAFLAQANDALRRVPGVQDVTWSENGLFSGTESFTSVSVSGWAGGTGEDSSSAYDQVGPGYVRAIGAKLLRGRDFSEADVSGRARVAFVNSAFAAFYLAGKDPIGQSIKLNDSTSVEIVGVVADVRDHSLDEAPGRRVYLGAGADLNDGISGLSFVVRVASDPLKSIPALRAALGTVDPLLKIDSAEPLDLRLSNAVGGNRMLALLALGFGVLSLLLAGVGLYGVMSYAMARRSGEIGVRVALGANRNAVIGMVLAEALRLVAVGLLIGAPLGIGAAQLVRSQLFGVPPADPWSLGVALLALLAGAFLAALIPALRASRVPPIVALQQE